MAVISMAIHNLNGTNRHRYTVDTLVSLMETVDFNKHKLYLADNESCEETKAYIFWFKSNFKKKFPRKNIVCVEHKKNIGTANAVNGGLKWALELGDNAIKMDNDVVVLQKGWVDDMEEVIQRMPKVGVLGLKRFDLEENPDHDNEWFRSRLIMIPHEKGKYDYVIEVCHHIMGTCTMYSHELIKRIGGLWQEGVYALDDSLYCVRAQCAGYYTAFLPQIKILHIDEGGDDYTSWKSRYAGDMLKNFNSLCEQYRTRAKDIYHPLK